MAIGNRQSQGKAKYNLKKRFENLSKECSTIFGILVYFRVFQNVQINTDNSKINKKLSQHVRGIRDGNANEAEYETKVSGRWRAKSVVLRLREVRQKKHTQTHAHTYALVLYRK